MNYLLAQTSSSYFRVLSQEADILSEIDTSELNLIDYRSGYKPDEDEWFRISSFSEEDYFIPECEPDFSTVNLNGIDNATYTDIECICIIQNGKKLFNRITPSLFVSRKKWLTFSGDPEIIEQRNQIEIGEIPDAIYVEEDDELIFRKLPKIKNIFPGIEVLHREATQEEVDEFLENEFLTLSDYTNEVVGTMNRKRLADIGEKYSALSDEKKDALIAYAKDKSGLPIVEDRIVIESDSDFKNLLYAMDQRYYTAEIYEEDRVANSVRVVNK